MSTFRGVLNRYSGWRMAVQPSRDGGCYLLVPADQIGDVCRVLRGADVPHSVDDIQLDGFTQEKLVRIEPDGRGEPGERVQQLLDEAEPGEVYAWKWWDG